MVQDGWKVGGGLWRIVCIIESMVAPLVLRAIAIAIAVAVAIAISMRHFYA